MFLSDEKTMYYITLLTQHPSGKNIVKTVAERRQLLPDEDSVAAEINLISMAVEPVHPGVPNRLRNYLNS